jgi:hypothetical protein
MVHTTGRGLVYGNTRDATHSVRESPAKTQVRSSRLNCNLETELSMKLSNIAAKAATKPSVRTPGPVTKATSAAMTTIDVKADVGFGNAVYLRGEGSGLTWDRGVQLSCVDGKTWRWSQRVAAPITFKVLLNDQVWSSGQDLKVAPGQKIEISPAFN